MGGGNRFRMGPHAKTNSAENLITAMHQRFVCVKKNTEVVYYPCSIFFLLSALLFIAPLVLTLGPLFQKKFRSS